MTTGTKNIKVEVWSDVVCPYCYLGKQAFERAIESFPEQQVEVVWRSFLLDPNTPVVAEKGLMSHLADSKGISQAQARDMMQQATSMAAQAGLEYHLDKVQVANPMDAHLLIHWAASLGKAPAVITLLFRAYFTQGRNIARLNTLQDIASQAGLDAGQAKEAIVNKTFQHQIDKDLYEAKLVDVRGVPFFLFNGKRAVPGALPASSFKMVLQRIIDHSDEP